MNGALGNVLASFPEAKIPVQYFDMQPLPGGGYGPRTDVQLLMGILQCDGRNKNFHLIATKLLSQGSPFRNGRKNIQFRPRRRAQETGQQCEQGPGHGNVFFLTKHIDSLRSVTMRAMRTETHDVLQEYFVVANAGPRMVACQLQAQA